MDTQNVDTSYQSFSSCLQELRDQLHTLHNFIERVDEGVIPGDAVLTKNLFHVIDHISCLVRDLKTGHIDYTNKPSNMFNVRDRNVFLLAFRKAYANCMHVLDDYYLEKLHSPMWVCRHKLADGKPFWSLSNITNEVSVLLWTVAQAHATLEASPIVEFE